MATAPSPNDLTRQQLDELDALLQKMLTVPLSAETPPPVASLNAMPQAPLPPSWRVDSPAPSVAQSMPHISLDEESAPMSLKFETPASRVTPAPLPTPAPSTPTPKPKVAPPSTSAAAPTATPTAAPKTPTLVSPTPAVAATPAPKASQSVAPVPIPQPKPLNVPVAKAPAPASIPTPAATPASTPASAIPAPNAVTPVPSAPPVPLPLLPLVAFNSLFNGVCGIFGPVGKLLRSSFFKQIYGLAGLGLLVYTAAHVGQVQGWITLPIQLPWPK